MRSRPDAGVWLPNSDVAADVALAALGTTQLNTSRYADRRVPLPMTGIARLVRVVLLPASTASNFPTLWFHGGKRPDRASPSTMVSSPKMQRGIQVDVPSGTWPNVPQAVTSSLGHQTISIPAVLLRLALSTRPPVVHGFELSDFWAWMRYAPALDAGPDLRLRHEWSTIDAHQKTVLSDELGVGFTTEFLIRTLHVAEFVDASYVLKVLQPGSFQVLRTGKRGQGKTPDYIGRLGAGRYCVLECKGTQSKVSALVAAMANGIGQKTNLQSGASARIAHSLVGGLFIPQNNSSESALLRFIDPDPDEFALVLDRVPIETVDAAILAVEAAKSLAFFQYGDIAEVLVSPPTADQARWENAKRMLATGQSDESRVVVERTVRVGESSTMRIIFRGGIGKRLLEPIGASRSPAEAIQMIHDRFALVESSHSDGDTGGVARVVTTLGCWFEVEIETSRA